MLKYRHLRLSLKVLGINNLQNLWSGKDFSDKVLVNEAGFYALVLGSELPQARQFQHWVTHEVLPQIRRTGGFIPVRDEQGGQLSDMESWHAPC